jgi:hypothetical protein
MCFCCGGRRVASVPLTSIHVHKPLSMPHFDMCIFSSLQQPLGDPIPGFWTVRDFTRVLGVWLQVGLQNQEPLNFFTEASAPSSHLPELQPASSCQ